MKFSERCAALTIPTEHSLPHAARVFLVLLLGSAFCNSMGALGQDRFADMPLPVSKIEALKLNVPVDLANGARVFNNCVGCHDAGAAGANGVGPILSGVVGRSAASVDGYDYSLALASAGDKGLVWSDYKLDAFLQAPSEFIAGNKMAFLGVKEEDARRDLIGYLKTLR